MAERQWHTPAIFRGRDSLPPVDPVIARALLAGPALFAPRLHDDRTFNVRAQTAGRARTSSASGSLLSGAPFIFSMTGAATIHRPDRIRASVNSPFRLFLISCVKRRSFVRAIVKLREGELGNGKRTQKCYYSSYYYYLFSFASDFSSG